MCVRESSLGRLAILVREWVNLIANPSIYYGISLCRLAPDFWISGFKNRREVAVRPS